MVFAVLIVGGTTATTGDQVGGGLCLTRCPPAGGTSLPDSAVKFRVPMAATFCHIISVLNTGACFT